MRKLYYIWKNNMNKKISVVVPVFNTEPEYIQVALESLFNQTLSDIEIIVVNDGSSAPNTIAYLKELESDKRLKILHQENRGLSEARNTAIDIATGDYIGFLDSDDWIDNNFYETLYNACTENHADIACGVLKVVENKTKYNLDKHQTFTTNNLLDILKNITNGSVCSKLIKRKLFNNIRFPSGLYYEDNLTLLNLLMAAKSVSFNNTVFYYYRSNPNSIVHDNKKHEKRVRDSLIILSKIKNIAKQHNKTYQHAIENTFLRILFMPYEYENNIEYKTQINKLFSRKYLQSFFPIKQKKTFFGKIINKIKRFIFRVQDGRIKIFKITVYKIKG